MKTSNIYRQEFLPIQEKKVFSEGRSLPYGCYRKMRTSKVNEERRETGSVEEV